MKFDLNDEKFQRKAGFIAMLLGILIIVGIGICFFLPEKEEPAESSQKEAVQLEEEERKALMNEINSTATGDADIDEETAKAVMGLNVTVSDEILERYLDGNRETLVSEMENFLVEYDFYMDVTKATCTQIVTMDYKKDIAYIEFILNDPARTVLTLEYKDHSKYDFNFR